MQQFPNSLELTAASALLLLSNVTEEKTFSKEKRNSSVSRYPNSSCSSLITDPVASSDEVLAHRLNVIAVVARCHEFKLKVVRRARSRVHHIVNHQKIVSVKPEAVSSGSVSTEASCLSSTSSATSCAARSQYAKRVKTDPDMEGMTGWARRMKHQRVGSVYMRCRADAILNVLARGCASEMKIRQILGDSPDTSKALRMLVRMEEVKRSGAGGRRDPYVYMIA